MNCEKVRVLAEDLDVTKLEKKSYQKTRAPKVDHVLLQDGKTVGFTRGEKVVEFEKYNHTLDNRNMKRK
jgi:hypothetical protein